MDVNEAREKVLRWRLAIETDLRCEVTLDDSRTQVYEWGWVFYFVASDPERCPKVRKQSAFAVERETGRSYPVGTKGLMTALRYFKAHRERDAAYRTGPATDTTTNSQM